jgi:hypothetical protein
MGSAGKEDIIQMGGLRDLTMVGSLASQSGEDELLHDGRSGKLWVQHYTTEFR